MLKKLFLLSLVIGTASTHAMKQLATKDSFCSLYDDAQNIIIDYATINTTANTLKMATKTVNALARTNKYLNALINNPQFSDNLIETYTHTFCRSHETVARLLSTQRSQQQLALQMKLKNLCHPYGHNRACTKNIMAKDLTSLMKKHINLEFTYDHPVLEGHMKSTARTALMFAVRHNCGIFELLLENGANINRYTFDGLTAAHISTDYPMYAETYTKIFQQPNFSINQQNKYGNSPLLHCLINKKKYCKSMLSITPEFTMMIKDFITAGADPELANNNGETPLRIAQSLNNETIIRIIQQAIDKKHNLNAPIKQLPAAMTL